MAFLLATNYRDDGFTHFIFDNGPTERVNFLSPPGTSREVLGMQPEELLRRTFADVRPPTVNRRRVK